MKKVYSLLFLALSFAIYLISAHPAQAIVVSPVTVEHELAPGMSATGNVRVSNDTNEEETYYVSIQTFIAKGEEGEQQYLPETDVAGLPSWFSLSTKSITLQPKESKEFEYTINVPPNGEPGGHYATLFFSTTPSDGPGSNVGIAAKTGIIFLVNVTGDIKESAVIESFTANNNIVSHLPEFMSLRIRNDGSVHLRPEGVLAVRNMWGGIVARVAANPNKSAILPNSVRRLNVWWAKSNDIDNSGTFFGELKNEWKNFGFGRYSATVDVYYGSKKTPLVPKTVTFWVIPWRLLTVFIIIALILMGIMQLYSKSVVSSAIKKPSKK